MTRHYSEPPRPTLLRAFKELFLILCRDIEALPLHLKDIIPEIGIFNDLNKRHRLELIHLKLHLKRERYCPTN